MPGFLAALCLAAGCATSQPAAVASAGSPLPTGGIVGRTVTVYPLTLLAAEEALGWGGALSPLGDALARADSLIAAALAERVPEVDWVTPAALRRAARQAPGMLPDPDRMGTAVLRAPDVSVVPDPLRSQMRQLTGVAGDRYALVPAALVFRRADGGQGQAELVVVMTDVRLGRVGFRTVVTGTGSDAWSALDAALHVLAPGLR